MSFKKHMLIKVNVTIRKKRQKKNKVLLKQLK